MLPKQELKKFARDRMSLVLAIGLSLTTIIVVLLLVAWLQPSDVQIPIRYNGFSLDLSSRPGTLFNDQWYERISFIIFAVMSTLASLFFAIKMHADYRILANFLLVFGIYLLIILALIGFFVNRTVTL